MIPYGRQQVTQEDIDAVLSVLNSDFLTQGPIVAQFESAVAKYVGAKYAVAVNSATSALHLACLGLGLGPGDLLWTSPITFVASANCALYCGAEVDFVDINPITYNLSVDALETKLTLAKKNGRLPKILVVVHMAGQSAEMDTINFLSHKYGFKVIEDASHAIGGKYKSHLIGGCQYSDVTVFSFHPVKIITSGEGGMAVTNSEHIASKLELLRSHGITRNSLQMVKFQDGPWYYEQLDLGFNYRMTDIQAALGLSQTLRIDDYVAKRNLLAGRYSGALKKLPLTLPYCNNDCYSANHLYVIRLCLNKISKTRLEVFECLRMLGVGVNVHYIPVHTQPYYQQLGFKIGDFPESERYYNEAISLPIFPGLTELQQDFVIQSLCEVLQ